MGDLRQVAVTKLATVMGIDMNAVAATVLFPVPIGKYCVITHIVIRGASISLTTADFGFGYGAGETDVIGHGTLGTGLTTSSKYRVLVVADGAEVGQPDADVLSIGVDVAQGAEATMNVDVFGFLF